MLPILTFALILVVALILFIREYFPLDISALILLCLLVLCGLVTKDQAFASFGSDALILIGSLFVMVRGLRNTGTLRRIEKNLLKHLAHSRHLSFVLLCSLVALCSAFVSNTVMIAVSMPIVLALCQRYQESSRVWLLPIAYASVLGGMCSLIGTSTNIIVSSTLPQYGIPELDLFTTAWVGVPALILGLFYLAIFTRPILGDGASRGDSIEIRYDLRPYIAEVMICRGSPLCEQRIQDTKLFKDEDIVLVRLYRKDTTALFPQSDLVFQAEDQLVVEGNIQHLTQILEQYGLKFCEQVHSKERTNGPTNGRTLDEKLQLHEVLVSKASFFAGRTPAEISLRYRYRISLIALHREGKTIREKLSETTIEVGDILVVQFLGHIDNHLLEQLGLVPLQELKQETLRTKLAPFAISIFALALVLGSSTSIPLALSCLIGALIMIATNIVSASEAYQAIRWNVLIFIGAILCLGKAMEQSGTADLLATIVSSYFIFLPPFVVIAFFFVITVILTQPLSNQAAVVIMLPLAIRTAELLELSAMPLVMAVTIAASCCFLTPTEPAFLLIYGPGGYRFTDFVRMGLRLTFVVMVASLIIIPIVWPFSTG